MQVTAVRYLLHVGTTDLLRDNDNKALMIMLARI